MKIICLLASLLFFPVLTHASDFQGFKSFFEQGQAPKNIEQVFEYLNNHVTCLGFNKANRTFEDSLVAQTLTLRPARGPAFPALTMRVLLLGRAQDIAHPQLNYTQSLGASELTLTTMKTTTTRSCEYYEGMGTVCSNDYETQNNLKLRIRFNGVYLTFLDETNGVYAYCW